MKKFDYLIVGSGLAGSVFAHEAKKRGKRCLILEKRDHTGGNVHCEMIEGIRVHKYGAHIFHTSNKRVWDFVSRFTEFNGFINCPVANYKGEIYNLPFNMNTFCRMWGISTPAEAAGIIGKQRAEVKGEPQNLEEQAISLVGRDLFEKLVMGYTEKQWGRSCTELPPSIIKRLPVRFTFDNNYFNDRYQGIPINGYDEIIEKLLEGCDIELNTDYNKSREKYDGVALRTVYTGMIDAYFGHVYGKLEYRSLSFENEVLPEKNHQGVAVMNYTDRETPYTRVIEHKHFELGEQPKTVITREYPAAWAEGMEAYYPVNDPNNQALYEKYRALAKAEKNTLFCGRLAEYRYGDMDAVIGSALAVADREFER